MNVLLELLLELLVVLVPDDVLVARRKGPKATKRGFLLTFPRRLRAFAVLSWFACFVASTRGRRPFRSG